MQEFRVGNTGNGILDRLPGPEFGRMMRLSHAVDVTAGELIARPRCASRFVHFPLTAVLSSTVILEDGNTIAGTSIGREGMLGIEVTVGTQLSSYQVEMGGKLLRIPSTVFTKTVPETTVLPGLLMRYALVLIERGALNSACVQHHSIEQRFCRGLLEMAWRSQSAQFDMTQEHMSAMLGVRRQSVNTIVGLLQERALIRCSRGGLTIIEQRGIEERACSCFHIANELYQQGMRVPAAATTSSLASASQSITSAPDASAWPVLRPRMRGRRWRR